MRASLYAGIALAVLAIGYGTTLARESVLEERADAAASAVRLQQSREASVASRDLVTAANDTDDDDDDEDTDVATVHHDQPAMETRIELYSDHNDTLSSRCILSVESRTTPGPCRYQMAGVGLMTSQIGSFASRRSSSRAPGVMWIWNSAPASTCTITPTPSCLISTTRPSKRVPSAQGVRALGGE